MLLGNLAGFRDAALIEATRALLLSDEFDFRDVSSLVYAGTGEPETREAAWTFFKDHYDAFAAKMRSDERGWALSFMYMFCDADHRADAAQFFTPRATFDGGPRLLANALDSIDQCIAQRARNAPDIAKFLSRY